jgi:hypothetical protein
MKPYPEGRFRKSGELREQTPRVFPQNHSPETCAAKSCRRPTRGRTAQKNNGMDVRKPSGLMIAGAGKRVSDLPVLRPGAQRAWDRTSKLDQKKGGFPPKPLRRGITPEVEPQGRGVMHASLHFSRNDQPFSRPRPLPITRGETWNLKSHRRGSSHLNSERMASIAWEPSNKGFARVGGQPV